jgi:HSP20 family protein
MASLVKREAKHPESMRMFDRVDQMFDEWTRVLPLRWPALGEWPATVIRVDEFHENGTLVVRAELPGIDPEKDVELTVSDRMLHIEAERREEEKADEKGYVRKEMRYGSFSRTLPLPEGVSEKDIKADYTNGILEVRIPAPQPKPATKIAIGTTKK